jgi:phosphatidylserine/phosphatidylglycerophosphate/cardiolipin synthase-like enzyme
MRKALALILVIFLGSAVLAAPQVYFSPDGNIKDRIIERIDASVDSIDVMCFELTSKPLASSLAGARKRGVRVRVLLDYSKTQEKNTMFKFLKKMHVSVKRISAPKDGIMHNKVALFDSKYAFTGSYNWTVSAEYYNYENALFLDDQQLVFEYQKEFNNLWDKAR